MMMKKWIIGLVFASLVLPLQRSIAGDRVTVAKLSTMQQIFLIKELKSGIKKIGILCNVSQHPGLKQKLARIGAQLGISMIIENTPDLLSVSKNFKHLVNQMKVEAIWVFPDGALNQEVAKKYLVKEAILSKVMLVTSDPEWVKKGATICAQKGNDQIRIFLNKKAVTLLGLEISDGFSKNFDLVLN
ncbi:MAG: hypothetical protein D6814_11400 [Calditrichaeota bacterium]|nr:MAG: hypothetical protein D6814_11400 [Calditrichota bacterium]